MPKGRRTIIPKIASSCNPRTVHPWENPSKGKNPRRPERCSVDEAIAPIHGLQVSSVPFRPSGLCLVVSSSETYRRGPVVFRAAAEAAEVGVTGSRGAQRPECRRLAKPKCRGEKKSQIRQMKWCPEAMSKAREAQCR
ncbi:hypothetical protein NOF04DRAFT_1043443 [Fusarium oxysporum II5]|nr:hypothetical protein NOF04DRAFT_1036356 [Fusarium oxysporum II5]KAK2134225.1 hypothetical protein NOF04DRAFT_1043443 [Fusarium oxysporum II5]